MEPTDSQALLGTVRAFKTAVVIFASIIVFHAALLAWLIAGYIPKVIYDQQEAALNYFFTNHAQIIQ